MRAALPHLKSAGVLDALIGRYGYAAILIGTFLEGETILALGGLAAHRGVLWLPGVMLCAFIGSVCSDQLFFFLGRRRGAAFVAKRPRLRPRVEQAQALVRRYDTLLILSFRFLYGLRNVTPLALGMSGISPVKFALLNAVGAAVWAVAIAALGWSVGRAAKAMLGHLERYELGIAAAIITAGVLLWLRRHAMQRRQAIGDTR